MVVEPGARVTGLLDYHHPVARAPGSVIHNIQLEGLQAFQFFSPFVRSTCTSQIGSYACAAWIAAGARWVSQNETNLRQIDTEKQIFAGNRMVDHEVGNARPGISQETRAFASRGP